MATAMSDSVTTAHASTVRVRRRESKRSAAQQPYAPVSIGEDTSGVASVMFLETRVRRSTYSTESKASV